MFSPLVCLSPIEKGYKKDRHTGDETINELYYGLKNGL